MRKAMTLLVAAASVAAVTVATPQKAKACGWECWAVGAAVVIGGVALANASYANGYYAGAYGPYYGGYGYYGYTAPATYGYYQPPYYDYGPSYYAAPAPRVVYAAPAPRVVVRPYRPARVVRYVEPVRYGYAEPAYYARPYGRPYPYYGGYYTYY